jgi:hypothetical protein
MALREFGGMGGRRWEVWDTIPSTPQGDYADTPMGRLLSSRSDAESGAGIPGRFTPGRESGWLTFASGTERRRLSPIPAGWESCDEDDLRGYLSRADRVASAPQRIGRQSRE